MTFDISSTKRNRQKGIVIQIAGVTCTLIRLNSAKLPSRRGKELTILRREVLRILFPFHRWPAELFQLLPRGLPVAASSTWMLPCSSGSVPVTFRSAFALAQRDFRFLAQVLDNQAVGPGYSRARSDFLALFKVLVDPA
jgi:hypothetical protein